MKHVISLVIVSTWNVSHETFQRRTSVCQSEWHTIDLKRSVFKRTSPPGKVSVMFCSRASLWIVLLVLSLLLMQCIHMTSVHSLNGVARRADISRVHQVDSRLAPPLSCQTIITRIYCKSGYFEDLSKVWILKNVRMVKLRLAIYHVQVKH